MITGVLVVVDKRKKLPPLVVKEARGTKIVIECPGGLVPGRH